LGLGKGKLHHGGGPTIGEGEKLATEWASESHNGVTSDLKD